MFSELRLPPIDDVARRRGHSFVTLAPGQVHYRLQGPPDGPKVCLVHGTTSPLFTFDGLATSLAEAGFQVLRFDLYGRGLSDRPRGRYDLPFFADQVRGVLDGVGFSGDVAMLGWSLGAVIAAEVATSPGEGRRVHELTLLAPAGFPIDMPWVARLTRVPGVGEVLMALVGLRALGKSWRSVFTDADRFEAYGERFVEQLRYRGFIPALLATLRNAPLEDATDTWRRLSASGIDTLILWGRDDGICPHDNMAAAQVALPEAVTETIAGVGHALHVQETERVARRVVEHFEGRWPAPATTLAEAQERATARATAASFVPWDRYGLRERFYATYGFGGEDPDGFGESELAFLRWELRRGALAPGKSAWWRAVNTDMNRDSELARLVHEAGLDEALEGAAAHWLAYLRGPSAATWYRAHNASIVQGYLAHRALARHETAGEQHLLNEVLYRVLFAQALATGAAVGGLGALAADPRRRAVEAITLIGGFYPTAYPVERDRHRGHTHRRLEEELEELLDDMLILPRLGALYEYAATELQMPELIELVDGYPG